MIAKTIETSIERALGGREKRFRAQDQGVQRLNESINASEIGIAFNLRSFFQWSDPLVGLHL